MEVHGRLHVMHSGRRNVMTTAFLFADAGSAIHTYTPGYGYTCTLHICICITLYTYREIEREREHTLDNMRSVTCMLPLYTDVCVRGPVLDELFGKFSKTMRPWEGGREGDPKTNIYIYIYIYTHVYMYIYIYIYTLIMIIMIIHNIVCLPTVLWDIFVSFAKHREAMLMSSRFSTRVFCQPEATKVQRDDYYYYHY